MQISVVQRGLYPSALLTETKYNLFSFVLYLLKKNCLYITHA